MGRTRLASADIVELEKRIEGFKKRIETAERNKKEIIDSVQELLRKYRERETSLHEYQEKLFELLQGKPAQLWLDYYNDYIESCKKHILFYEKEIKGKKRKKLAIAIIPIVSVFVIFLVLVGGFYFTRKGLTGLTVDGEDEHEVPEEPVDQESPAEPADEEIPEETEPESEEQKESFSEETQDEEASQEGASPSQSDASPSHEEPSSSETEEEISGETPEELLEELPGGNETDVPEEENATIPEAPEEPESNVTMPEIPEEPVENVTIPETPEENITMPDELEVPGENITIPKTPENITEVPVNITPEIPVNVTVFGEVNVSTLQYKAVINRPQKWIKVVEASTAEDMANLTLELPKGAGNISVKTGAEVQEALLELEQYDELIESADKDELVSGFITGNVALDLKEGKGLLTRFFEWLKSFTITGNVIREAELQQEITETPVSKIVDVGDIAVQTNENEIAVEYYTSGPISFERDISNGKRVIVSAEDEENYTDVLAFTQIPEEFDIDEKGRIKIFWREQGTYVSFNALDLDGNGKLDYVEWVAPHLSNQTFDIIFITKAEHLDSNRNFISDIYEEVRELDGNWSEAINDSEYVRVTFEVPLDSTRDITLWPRTVSGTPKIEVYEVNGTELIAEFDNLIDDEYNKVFLTSLQGTQDTFDLRVVGGGLEFDHIIDPMGGTCSGTATPETPFNATASTEFSASFPATNAIDGSTSTYWFSEDKVGFQWIRFNLTEKKCISMINVSVFSTYSPETMDIEVSDDLSTWTTVSTQWTETSEGAWDALSFTETAGQYIRLNMTASQSILYTLTEINVSTRTFTAGLGVTINFPANTTYSSKDFPLDFNVTLSGNGSAEYSLDGGINNVTMSGEEGGLFGTEFNATNSSIADGSYTFNVYANDTSGTRNDTESVVFSVDRLTSPTTDFVSPTPDNASSQSNTDIYVNVSSSDSSRHYSFVDFNKDLIFWMRMDDTNSSGDPTDLSSYSNNGSLLGNMVINSTGMFGNATHGTGLATNVDRIEVANNANLNFNSSNEITVSALIYRKGLGCQGTNTCAIVAKNDLSNFLGWAIYTAGTGFGFSFRNGTGVSFSANTAGGTINNGQWYHVAGVYNGTNVSFYIDGSLNMVKGYSGGWADSSDVLKVGARNVAGTGVNRNYFNGTIDDVLVFNRSLSADEISALYNATASQYFNNFTGLMDGTTYEFTGYAVDINGNKNQTSRQVTVDSTAVSSCKTLSGAGTTYTLQNNIVATGTCFTVTANDITLDGAGYNVTGNSSGFGVDARERANFTIQNINMTNFTNSLDISPTSSGSSGGNLIIINSTLDDVISDGTNGNSVGQPNGGNGGDITLTTSNVSVISTDGGGGNGIASGDGGDAGKVSLTNSQATNITALGGNAKTSGDNNGNGGTVILENVNINLTNGLVNITKGVGGKAGTHGQLTLNYTGGFEDLNADYGINFSLTIINGTANGGMIKWLSTLEPKGRNFNLSINTEISSNFTFVDSANVPELNKSANVTLFGTPGAGISNPELKRDGSACGGLCYNFTALSDATVVFNVSYWSNYSLGESNSAPVISFIAPIAATNPTEDAITYFDINLTASDSNGAGDLDNASVQARLQATGETTRLNTTCATLGATFGNSQNYTCRVGLQYYDANTAWTINVTMNDTAGLVAENSTSTLTFNLLTAMKMSPTALAWPGTLTVSSTDVGSTSDPIVVNNTGNDDISNIQVTAIDLAGEVTATEFIYAANFTVNINDASEGTAMVNGTATQVASAVLNRGNHSINNGTEGQEELYFYLEVLSSDLSSQSYSSASGGAWTITILAVPIIIRRKRKKKNRIKNDNLVKALALVADELKEKFSQNKEEAMKLIVREVRKKYGVNRSKVMKLIEVGRRLDVPITIFSGRLGGLEGLVKYMKENLSMNYSEIAYALSRNPRTIWTAYNKALEKQKTSIDVKKTDVHFSVEIFKDRNLTVLESIILHLREKGFRYSEIAKLISRDERNVWTIHSSAIKKKGGKRKNA